jgi:hypothetical protein
VDNEATKMIDENRTIDSIIRGNLIEPSFGKHQLELFRRKYTPFLTIFKDFMADGSNMKDTTADAVTKAFDYRRFIDGKDMDVSFDALESSNSGNITFYAAACAFGVESLRKAATLPDSAEKDNVILNGYFALYMTGNTETSNYAGKLLSQAFETMKPFHAVVLSGTMWELSRRIDNYYLESKGRQLFAKDIMPWRHKAEYDILDDKQANHGC